MLYFLFFFFSYVFCFEKNNSNNKNENNKTYFNNNLDQKITKKNSNRRLVSFEPIRIYIETTCLEKQYSTNSDDLEIIKTALSRAKTTLEKLIKVEKYNQKIRFPNTITVDENIEIFNKYFDNNFYEQEYEADLVIYFRILEIGNDLKFLTPSNFSNANFIIKPNIYHYSPVNGRPIIGTVVYNDRNNVIPNNDKTQKIEFLSYLFLHEFTHILGFTKSVLKDNNIIGQRSIKSRLDNLYSNKLAVINTTFLEKSRKYFNCSEINYLELDDQINKYDFEEIHWESRLFLGDYMIGEIYYPDQVISELTLDLLNSLNFYEVNMFTGGLSNFGKNKGCSFIENDCINVKTEIEIISNFPNEFCSSYEKSNAFGTCSTNRQSMGYCINSDTSGTIKENRRKKEILRGLGQPFIEYCPTTYEVEKVYADETKNENYNGNCKIGNHKYGADLTDIRGVYEYYSNIFDEGYGDKSFCALSSILKQDETDLDIIGIIRPTCYPMSCSNTSLTIQIKDEFIVCPPNGGLVKIQDQYSKYKGLLFCPDYNLICSGTELCNNMFDCVEKNSTIKQNTYNYNINEVYSTIGLKTNKEAEINDMEMIAYEKSTNGQCPINCRHCNSYHQCINCDNSHPLYVGNKEGDTDIVECRDIEPMPNLGYYKNENYKPPKIYYFTCIENCKKCDSDKNKCQICSPTHYVKNDTCEERIRGCRDYNNSSSVSEGGVEYYTKCLNCKNNESYYCVNDTKEACVQLTDYDEETYFKTENKDFPCVKRCDVAYKNCKKCNNKTCTECQNRNSFINKKNNCVEKIEHCSNQNNFTDEKECIQCREGYYCVNGDTSKCTRITNNLNLYYKYNIAPKETDGNIECYIMCSDLFDNCLGCTKYECTKCENGYFIYQGKCVSNITGCIDHIYDGVKKECKMCNMAESYYCFNNSKTECKKVDLNTYIEYYYLTEENDSPCYSSCSNFIANCLKCDGMQCNECTKWYIINDAGNHCLVKPFIVPDNDNCTLIIHELDKSIYEIDPFDYMDIYWNNIPYVSIVEHYIGENYTITVFIFSSCTEELLNEGYFKLNTTELDAMMIKENKIEGMKYLFSVFINYNHKSHLRHYNLTSWYYNPHKVCEPCLDIDYTITNKFYNPLKEALGLSIANLVNFENIDIIDKDSDVYNNICKNVTPNGIDIPLKKRLNYLYLHKYLEEVLCISENCTMEEYYIENLTIVCKCRIGNTFEDLLNSEKFEFIPYEGETKSYNDFVDSFQIIKCAINGFKAKNIKSNIGFFICIIFIAIQIALFIYYFLFSKPLVNVNKSIKNMSNPPKKSILKIITDWGKILGRNNLEDEDEIYVQPRDDADDQLLEEERSYENDGNIIDLSGLSIDTNVGGAIRNISTGNKLKEKADQKKVLILLSNKGKNKSKNLIEDLRSDSDIIPLPEDELNNSGNLNYGKIYWYVLSLKQHIINYFSFIDFCNITESHIPFPIKLIRSLFMIITSFVINVLWLNQTYYEKKFEYFNKEYNILYSENDISIPTGKKIGYAIGKTFAKALLSFVILLVVQLLLGIIFFSVIKSVIKIRKNKAIQDLSSKVKIKNIVFFIIVMVLMIIFLFVLGGFVGAYGGGAVDYFTAGIISLIFLEIFPFIWSLIIALFRYYGIKKKNKYLFKIALFFMF